MQTTSECKMKKNSNNFWMKYEEEIQTTSECKMKRKFKPLLNVKWRETLEN